jgi:periplasmic protein TonB
MAEAVTAFPSLPQTESALGGTRLLLCLGLSVAIHGAAVYGLLVESHRLKPAPNKSEEITVDIQTVPKPPPPVVEPPPPPKPMPAAHLVRIIPKEAPPPPTPAAPPPPTHQAPAPITAPMRIGVTLDSTVENGAFAAPVGNTLYGVAPKIAPPPDARPYWAAKFVPPQQVAELPVLVNEVKAPYPPLARKAGIEGQVVMMLTIDANGKVARVRKLVGPGHGLDEAAVVAAGQFVFKPARYNGNPVATEIRYVYSFEID